MRYCAAMDPSALASLLPYVGLEDRPALAAQLEAAEFGGDEALAQQCQIAVGELRAARSARKELPRERVEALAADEETRTLLRARWDARARWDEEFQCEPSRTCDLRVRAGGRQFALRSFDHLGALLPLFEVLAGQCYEGLPAVPRVYDVGAHLGFASVAFAAQMPSAELVCVEPVPANVVLLRHNLEANGLPARIVPAALADRPGRVVLHVARSASSVSSCLPLALTGLEAEDVEVAAITPEELLEGEGFGLKLDVEGAEHLFVSRPGLLARARWVAGELHFGPDLAPPAVSSALWRVLSETFDLQVHGPGVFGRTVTYTFQGVRR